MEISSYFSSIIIQQPKQIKKKVMNTFKFTTPALWDEFTKEFKYMGSFNDNISFYYNPYTDRGISITMAQIGDHLHIYEIDGWNPEGMTIEQVIDKLKN